MKLRGVRRAIQFILVLGRLRDCPDRRGGKYASVAAGRGRVCGLEVDPCELGRSLAREAAPVRVGREISGTDYVRDCPRMGAWQA